MYQLQMLRPCEAAISYSGAVRLRPLQGWIPLGRVLIELARRPPYAQSGRADRADLKSDVWCWDHALADDACPATIKMGMRDNQDGNLVAGLSA